MAIATSTAIAGASLALTAASTAGSFIQAGKQRDAMRQAEADAETAMKEARKKLETNFYEGLSINKEPYELQREALLSSGAQAIQAGVESERGAAATAGRVQMAQNEAQAGIRSDMGREMQQLEQLTAQEESRLRDVGAQLDLEEVAGAQLAAANAQELAAQAQQQGMEGVVSLGQQAVSYLPLYQKTNPTLQPLADVKVGQLPPAMAAYAAQQDNAAITPPLSNTTNNRPFLQNNKAIKPITVSSFLQNKKPKQQPLKFNNPSPYKNPFDIYGIR
jgi:hypothetical protein